MKFRVRKGSYRLLVMIASPLLALALGGVGRASVTTPGPTNFVEIDLPANLGRDATLDWANGGANASPRDCTETPLASGTCTCTAAGVCSGTECLKHCNGSGCLFDGGVYHSGTSNPTPPSLTAAAMADPHIVAAVFGVDELGISGNVAKVCTVSLASCTSDSDCTAGTGDTCHTCGGGDPTVYTGQGSETNNSNLNDDTWSTATVPNKDDISNVYAISHQDPVAPVKPTDADTNEIFAGFERVINDGDSHVDLEFLQQAVSLIPSASCVGGTNAGGPCVSDSDCPPLGTGTCKGRALFPCQGKFSGSRSQGDLLVAVDFTRGGALGSVVLYSWTCNTTPPSPQGTVCDPTGSKTGPHYEINPSAGPAVKASVNGGICSTSGTFCSTARDCPTRGETCVLPPTTTGCGGWACRDKNGVETSTLPLNEAFEVGVDLAAIGFKGCISTFLPHTRSSQSFTAVLKDFKLLQFNTCRPTTILTKQVCDSAGNCADSQTINVGDSVVYKYTEQNDGNVALKNPHVTDDKCSPVILDTPSGDANTNGVLDPGETWHFKCTKSNIQTDVGVNTALGHADFKSPSGQTEDVTACQGTCSVTTSQKCYVDVDPHPAFGTIGCPSGEICVPPNPSPTATFCDQDEVAQANVTVKKPSTCLKKSATVTKIQTTVLYTYAEKNDGQVPLTMPSVDDAECTGNSGAIMRDPANDINSNGDTTLDPGETFAFKCTATFTEVPPFTDPQQFINVAASHGHFMSNGADTDVTCPSPLATDCGCTPGTIVNGKFCDRDERDTKTVTVSVPTVTGGKASCPNP